MKSVLLTNIINIKQLNLFLLAYIIFTASVGAENESQSGYVFSEDLQFRLSYKSKQEPVPLNQIHHWVLRVETKEGHPVENAVISIDGGMPAHNHGLPTQPVASEIGNGEYLVEGLKFSMTGYWELWFYIQTDNVTDKVKFELEF